MNKVINIFSGIILLLYCGLVMGLIFDLSFSSASLKGIPYQLEICTTFALLILLLGVLRIKRKWQGAKDMSRFKNFHFVRQVSKPALRLSLLYTLAEVIFTIVFIIFLTRLAFIYLELVLPMIIVMCLILIESIYFSVRIGRSGPSFRVGINKKAVAYFNREMHILYFIGLRRIELHQDMINFQYKDDLNIFLPLEVLNPEDRLPFRESLIETIETHVNVPNGKNIYIDDAFRSLK